MRRRDLALALTLILSACLPCAAKTTQELLQECEDTEQFFDQGVCIGYVRGVTEMFPSIKEINQNLCMPSNVTYRQMIGIFIKWARENPEQWHESAYISLANALLKAFPCEK